MKNSNHFTNKINDNDMEKFLENIDLGEFDFITKEKENDQNNDPSCKSNLLPNLETNTDMEWIALINIIIKGKIKQKDIDDKR